MKYTIYQITNTINGKIYIGKHQTENINDSYFGSGTALRNAIKKYGKEYFLKEVLYVFDTEAEMNQKERELITEEFVNRPDTYNLGVGGEGGPHRKGKLHSEETKEKMRNSRVNIITTEYRQKMSVIMHNIQSNRVLSADAIQRISDAAKLPKSDEHKQKISDSIKRNHTIETRQKISQRVSGNKNPMFSKIHSTETKQKISDALKGKPSREVTCPYCSKIGGVRNMVRYHFNNCKHKDSV